MKKILSAMVSLLILFLIYSRLDLGRLAAVFKDCRLEWLIPSLAFVIPTTLFTSWRLKIMAPSEIRMRLSEAMKLTLSASVLNMVLPSKMGDLAKAYFIRDKNKSLASISLPLVIFEKTCDVLVLLAWCALGLLLLPKEKWLFWPLTIGILLAWLTGVLILGYRRFTEWFFRLIIKIGPFFARRMAVKLQEAWHKMYDYFWQDKPRLILVIFISLLIWFLHLLQIWMFILALGGICRFIDSLGLTSLSIFAGLLPITFAGIGTRDAALIFFYKGYFVAEMAAALGLLYTLRYIMPAIGGLPFFSRYLAAVRLEKASGTSRGP